MPTFANFAEGRPQFAPSEMPSTFPVPLYTVGTPVSNVELCPPPTAPTSFGPEVSSLSGGPDVGGSSAPAQDGDDGDKDDIYEEVNV